MSEQKPRLIIAEQSLEPKSKPSCGEIVRDLIRDPAEQQARDGIMRMADASAYAMAGAMMTAESPGLPGKIAGGALIAKSIFETWVATQAYEGMSNRGTVAFMGMRDRVAEFGRSLIDKSTGKFNFRDRMRRNVGEGLAAVEDSAYRNAFSRMTGGIAMVIAGVEFMNQPGLAPKLVGTGMAILGTHESYTQGLATNDHVMAVRAAATPELELPKQ